MERAELIARKKELESQIAELEAQRGNSDDAQAMRIARNDYLMKGDRSGIDDYRQNKAIEASAATTNASAAAAGISAAEDARMSAKFDLESAQEKYAVALAAAKQSSTPSTRAEARAALVDVRRALYAAQKLGVDTHGSMPATDGGEPSVQSLISQATALKSRAGNKKYVPSEEIVNLKKTLDDMGDAEGAAAASAALQDMLDKGQTSEGEEKRNRNAAQAKAKAKAKHLDDLKDFVQSYKIAFRIGEDLSTWRTNPLYKEALKLGLIESIEKAGR